MEKGNGTASMVLGILGLMFCWIPVLGAILPIIALVVAKDDGMSTAGKVMSWISLAWQIFYAVLFIIGVFIGFFAAATV